MSDRSRRPPPLYWRVLLASLFVVATVAITGGVLVARSWERQAREQLTQSIATSARILTPAVRDSLSRSPTIASMQPLAEEIGRKAGCRVTIIARDGRVLGDSEETLDGVAAMENHADRPEVLAAHSGGIGTNMRRSSTLRYQMLYVAVPVETGGEVAGVLRLAVPFKALSVLRSEIRWHVVTSLAVGLLAAAILGAWLTLRLTRPMSRLAHVARAYAGGDFAARAEGGPFREAGQLAEALHAMADSTRDTIEQLTSERNEARVTVERLVEGVIAVDGRGRVLTVNPAACRLLGLSGQSIAGRNLFEVVRVAAVREIVRKVLREGRPAEEQVIVFEPEERTLHVQGLPCGPADAAGPRAVVVLHDRTELDRYERLRREFVANVSHELKSPLTSIRGLTETLLDGALEDGPAARRFVELIDMDAERLSRLIDDLLSLSRIESQPAAPIEPVELRPVVESVIETLQPAVDRRRLAVDLELPAGDMLRGNPDRLRQVLWNLLDNAIKYNRDGGRIKIGTAREGAMIRVLIADTGLGIPEEAQARIFERFYRADKARSRDLGGTGLGLSIVKHIVESESGTVRVESVLDEGSVFSFTLPAAD